MNKKVDCGICEDEIKGYKEVIGKLENWQVNAKVFYTEEIKKIESQEKCKHKGQEYSSYPTRASEGSNLSSKECADCGEYIITLSDFRGRYSDTEPHECQSNQTQTSNQSKQSHKSITNTGKREREREREREQFRF